MSCDMALSNRVLDPRSLKQELDLSRWFGKIAVLVYLKKKLKLEAEIHTLDCLDINLFKTEIFFTLITGLGRVALFPMFVDSQSL